MMRGFKILAFSGASVLALSVPAYAQDATADEPSAPEDSSEIVVTGTLIRGVAPAGANVIGVSEAAIESTGAVSTTQLFEKIPQLGFFNNLQSPNGGFSNTTTNRPNLRNLPGFNTAGSSPTLLLVDGIRVVGAGVLVTSPDSDIIPPGALERVEIVPDGGSALYGSDAVAGVINLITKKKADGLDLGARYGFGRNGYHTLDIDASIGKSWDRGSIYLTYGYAENAELRGEDLDYVFYPVGITDGVQATSLLCSPGNVTIGNVFIPGSTSTTVGLSPSGAAVPGTLNQCDPSDPVTIYPKSRRHSLLAGLSQELNDSVSMDIRAFYTNRVIESNVGPFQGSVRFGPSALAAFGFLPLPAANRLGNYPAAAASGETQTVYFSFGGEDAAHHRNDLETYGISSNFRIKLGENFQLSLLGSYGESEAAFRGSQAGNNPLNTAAATGLFNPYNPAASNPAALAAISNYESVGIARQRQFDARAVIDGELFALPGGGVKIAVGAEYLSSAYINQGGTIVTGTENTGYAGLSVNGVQIIAPQAALPLDKLTRNIESAFGEVSIPIFGADNATTMLQELTLSAAGRYDRYSDAGGTFNPKFGATWRPVYWLKVRGNWGKSFVAPSLADLNASGSSINFATLSFLYPQAAQIGQTVNGVVIPAVNGRPVALLLGNKPGLENQKATTWSIGADIDPPFAPGLKLSATYWNIDLEGGISIPSFTSPTFYANFAGTPAVVFEPTAAQLADVTGQVATISGISCGGGCYAIIDARKQNLSRVKLSGLDLGVSYFRDTSFGSLDFAVNANYELKRDQQATPGALFIDQLEANFSKLKLRATAGARVGALYGQVAWNHTAGYDLNPPVGVGIVQDKVKSFNVIDLFFKYDVAGEGALGGLSFTLNVSNLLDQDPPVYLQNNSLQAQLDGYTNGATVGRLVQLGVTKKF